MSETKTKTQETDGTKPKTVRKQTTPAVKDEIQKLEKHIHDLQDAVDLSNKVIVCLLLKACRGLGEKGYESLLKRFWNTTGGAVFDEDTLALQRLLDDTESTEILEFFLEDLMSKHSNVS